MKLVIEIKIIEVKEESVPGGYNRPAETKTTSSKQELSFEAPDYETAKTKLELGMQMLMVGKERPQPETGLATR